MQRGWICDSCDILNLETGVCQNCGLQRNYFRKCLKLYKLHNIWGTAKEHSVRFRISETAVREHANDKK